MPRVKLNTRGQCLWRCSGKRTVDLNTTKNAPDCEQETICLGVVQEGDERSAGTGIDGKALVTGELL